MVVRVDLSTFVTIMHLPEIVRIFLDIRYTSLQIIWSERLCSLKILDVYGSPAVRADEMPKEMEGIKGGGEYIEYGCRDMPAELLTGTYVKIRG